MLTSNTFHNCSTITTQNTTNCNSQGQNTPLPMELNTPSLTNNESSPDFIQSNIKKINSFSYDLNHKTTKEIKVIQRKTIYVLSIPQELATKEILSSYEYFGQYGDITKVIINKKGQFQSDNSNTVDTKFKYASAYITFSDPLSAALSIIALECNKNEDLEDIKASYGLTSYCKFFIRQKKCRINQCNFYHIKAPKSECIFDFQNLSNFDVFQVQLKYAFDYAVENIDQLINMQIGTTIQEKTHLPNVKDAINMLKIKCQNYGILKKPNNQNFGKFSVSDKNTKANSNSNSISNGDANGSSGEEFQITGFLQMSPKPESNEQQAQYGSLYNPFEHKSLSQEAYQNDYLNQGNYLYDNNNEYSQPQAPQNYQYYDNNKEMTHQCNLDCNCNGNWGQNQYYPPQQNNGYCYEPQYQAHAQPQQYQAQSQQYEAQAQAQQYEAQAQAQQYEAQSQQYQAQSQQYQAQSQQYQAQAQAQQYQAQAQAQQYQSQAHQSQPQQYHSQRDILHFNAENYQYSNYQQGHQEENWNSYDESYENRYYSQKHIYNDYSYDGNNNYAYDSNSEKNYSSYYYDHHNQVVENSPKSDDRQVIF